MGQAGRVDGDDLGPGPHPDDAGVPVNEVADAEPPHIVPDGDELAGQFPTHHLGQVQTEQNPACVRSRERRFPTTWLRSSLCRPARCAAIYAARSELLVVERSREDHVYGGVSQYRENDDERG